MELSLSTRMGAPIFWRLTGQQRLARKVSYLSFSSDSPLSAQSLHGTSSNEKWLKLSQPVSLPLMTLLPLAFSGALSAESMSSQWWCAGSILWYARNFARITPRGGNLTPRHGCFAPAVWQPQVGVLTQRILSALALVLHFEKPIARSTTSNSEQQSVSITVLAQHFFW